jgi:uroporphyrin-III C-methyltransferase / precorrin-2 dehydrogenase / sirohydrochlorin ferrochelatase
VHSLPVFLRLDGRAVILLGEGPAAEPKRRLLERAGARIVGEDAAAALAVVALDAPEAAVARLRARGVLVNAVDRPDLCDFTLPAIVERGPVLVAIGTGGVSAGLAAALRQRIEALLPAGLGRVAEALHAGRETLRARFPDGVARRRAIGALLAPGGALDPLVEHDAIDLAGMAAGADRIERVRIASADPDELTLRAARLLGLADRVYHPADMPPDILNRARADAERIAGAAPAVPLPGLSIVLERVRP